MGHRALGPHWQAISGADRRVFVSLFSELLSRAYFYRARFTRLLQTESYDALVRRLRERVESLER